MNCNDFTVHPAAAPPAAAPTQPGTPDDPVARGAGRQDERAGEPGQGETTHDVTDAPPFLVEIAWDAVSRIYILFGALFVVALSVLAALLLRMKIFQAIKLGETV